MSLDFCLETNMLKLSYKHSESPYYCYFHVFSIVKTTLCIYILYMNGVTGVICLTDEAKKNKNTYFPIHYRLLNRDCY